jgi:hypothetical protein
LQLGSLSAACSRHPKCFTDRFAISAIEGGPRNRDMPPKLSLQKDNDVEPAWSATRIVSLLSDNVEEIKKEQPSFFGTLKIEVNFRAGEIETVVVNRRQTFKD